MAIVPLPGERGKQGDHGQEGQDGRGGQDGRDGRTGLTGPTGDKGEAGPPIFTRLQTLVLVAFVVGVGLLLAHRSEVNTNGIKQLVHERAQSEYAACVARNTNLVRLNTLYSGIVKIEKANPVAAPATIRQRVDLYRSAKLDVIDCGPKP